MLHSPPPNTPQTAAKATMGGLGAALSVVMAALLAWLTGAVEMPADAEIEVALLGIATAAASGAVTWVMTYAKANRTKEESSPTLFSFAPFILFLFLLAGCATRVGDTPAQVVYGLQADYNAALAIALAYESQPRCEDGQDLTEAVCSDPEVVEIIRAADDKAWAGIAAAQDVVLTPGATDDAVSLAIASARAAVDVFEAVIAEEIR